jgi:hypothetical protein
MNVFAVDVDPKIAAQSLCNKHVCKMPLESAQLLCTAYPLETSTPYQRTHVNHPCARWTRQSSANFEWLLLHSFALCDEYTARFGRTHASEAIIIWCAENAPPLPNVGLTPFARAIKEPWKAQTLDLPVDEAYRRYYVGDKARFARWTPRARPPSWWPDQRA